MVTGSLQECGIASNATGILPADNTPSGSLAITKIRKMINQPLFEAAATGIQSDNLLERSLGVAALSALSQPFLSCSSVRKRGYLSECWKATDPFILEYPVLSRFVTKDDVVVIIGHGTEIMDLREEVREIHIMNSRSPDIFRTLLIDSSVKFGLGEIIFHSGDLDAEILNAADIIFIDATALIDSTFENLMQHTGNARMVGLCGLSGSLIPDAFFDQGLDFISSFRIMDPDEFAKAMNKGPDVEFTFKTRQKQYLMMNPSTTSG
jgi:uncharacterized protein (DUF4213/DUF364 family)